MLKLLILQLLSLRLAMLATGKSSRRPLGAERSQFFEAPVLQGSAGKWAFIGFFGSCIWSGIILHKGCMIGLQTVVMWRSSRGFGDTTL